MKESETMTLLNQRTGKLETFNVHTGELVVVEGQNLPAHLYTIEIGDAICNLVREGMTYDQICKMPGMPQKHLIFRWRDFHPDFAARLKKARIDRATIHHEKAIAVLEESDTIEKDEVPRQKFRFDSYMKLAERAAPEEFGQQTKVQHENAAPTMIVINTGINRDEPITLEGVCNEKEDSDGERHENAIGRTSQIGAEIEGLTGGSGAEAIGEREGEIGSESFQEEGGEEEEGNQEESKE